MATIPGLDQWIQQNNIPPEAAQILLSLPPEIWQDQKQAQFATQQAQQYASTKQMYSGSMSGADIEHDRAAQTEIQNALQPLQEFSQGDPAARADAAQGWWSRMNDPNNHEAIRNRFGGTGSWGGGSIDGTTVLAQLAAGGFMGASGILGGASAAGGAGDATGIGATAGEGVTGASNGMAGLGEAGGAGAAGGVATGGVGAGAGTGAGTGLTLNQLLGGAGAANSLLGGGGSGGGSGSGSGGGLNFGAALPGIVGAIGAAQQRNQLTDLAHTLWDTGAPSRGRYEASMQPGFDPYASIGGYRGAVDTANDSLLRRLSANGGNPFGNPGGLIEAQKQVINGTALPAIQNYQQQNANSGGLSNLSGAYTGIAQAGINAGGGVQQGLGSALAGLTGAGNQIPPWLQQLIGNNGSGNGGGTTWMEQGGTPACTDWSGGSQTVGGDVYGSGANLDTLINAPRRQPMGPA